MGLSVNRQMAKKINRQPSKTEYFYRQPSNERAKLAVKFLFLMVLNFFLNNFFKHFNNFFKQFFNFFVNFFKQF